MLKILITNNEYTNLKTKFQIYKSLIKPMWTYGLQLWGNAKKTNLNKIQTVQNKSLRKIINAPPYISNQTLHLDLKIKTIKQEAISYFKRYHARLYSHPNSLISSLSTLSIPGNPSRRLKRKWCRDLLSSILNFK